MIIKGCEVNFDNLSDWSVGGLRNFKQELDKNIKNHLGDCSLELLLIKLIDIEIEKKIKIENIRLAAFNKQQDLISRYDRH